MKNLEYYLNHPYRLEIVPDTYESGYVASYPELPGCITCAETIAEVKASALDAKKSWLMSALEVGDTIQEPEYNKETIDAIKESEDIFKNSSKYKSYTSPEETIKDILEKNDL